jgi:hypothetical protein
LVINPLICAFITPYLQGQLILSIIYVNDFLKSQSLVDTLKAWGKYIIATIIPTAVSKIQLIWTR